MEFQTPPKKNKETFFPPKPNPNEFRKKVDITKCSRAILKFDDEKDDDRENRKSVLLLRIKRKHAVKT